MFFRLVWDHEPMSIASSAYKRWEMFGPLFGRWIPVTSPKVVAQWRMVENASIAIMKMNGDMGSPWGTPRSQLNSDVGHPLTRTADLVEDRIPFIQAIDWENPFVALRIWWNSNSLCRRLSQNLFWSRKLPVCFSLAKQVFHWAWVAHQGCSFLKEKLSGWGRWACKWFFWGDWRGLLRWFFECNRWG